MEHCAERSQPDGEVRIQLLGHPSNSDVGQQSALQRPLDVSNKGLAHMSGGFDQVLTRVEGSVGFATLNRPKAINALTHEMVTALHAVLVEWASDPAITAVVLDGAGDRGLCAGGDIVAIYQDAIEGGGATRRFWFDEYRLNSYIASYPKPYVAMMDGLVMGGGVGVGAHGSHRIVTEKSKIGMPEVGIGFIPDVGGTYLLSRAPRSMGLHAALTGAPFSGADSIALGFADYFVPHDRLGDLARAISADGVDAAIAEHAVKPPPSQLAQLHWITQCYAGDSVTDIVAALRAHAEQQANAAAELISSRSPIALAVTLESVRRAADLPTLKDVLLQEYRVACTALNSHDLVEGIRAQVIDKDRNAKWSPSSASDVTAGDVDGYFANTGTDLKFDVVMDS